MDPMSDERRFLDVNVFGPLSAMQAAIPRMRQHGGGLIINISSGASRAAIPGLAAYGASKAALDLVSNTARKQLPGPFSADEPAARCAER